MRLSVSVFEVKPAIKVALGPHYFVMIWEFSKPNPNIIMFLGGALSTHFEGNVSTNHVRRYLLQRIFL